MGHREDLLEGAKRCLYERGYAHTTARDIVAASGTNLASIGYHFGSKDALLNAAMLEVIEEWGAEMAQSLAADMTPAETPLDRFEALWTRMIASFTTHQPLWLATFEALAQARHSPEVREFIGGALQQGREGLVTLFHSNTEMDNGDAAEEVDAKAARTVGSLYQALLTGIWVQWLIDPERAPSGADIVAGLQQISAKMKMAEAVSDDSLDRPNPE